MNDRLNSFLGHKGLELRRLDEDHFVDYFDCGRDQNMNSWFHKTAMKWQCEDMCTVWVLSKSSAPSDCLGFFTLSSHQIIPGNVHKKLRASNPENKAWVNNLKNPLPAQLLGKFALDAQHQGTGLGEILMTCVYYKFVEVAETAGAKFLVLDVQEPNLVDYYKQKFGFERSTLAREIAQMYRPTSVIRQELLHLGLVKNDHGG